MYQISKALENYKVDNGVYPTTEQGLSALTLKPTEGPVPLYYRQGGYYKGHFLDPWGHDYIYQSVKKDQYIILSYGQDNRPGGIDYNSDIKAFVGGSKQ